MSYTLLRVVEAGVVLREGHRERFGACAPALLEQFDAFCTEAPPGIYALREAAGELRVTQRERSAIVAGMRIGFAPSPYFGVGDFPKPAPPCPYDEVRIDGVCTFLTDDRGEEVIEACRGIALAVVDGTLLRARTRYARVTSVTEAFLAGAGVGSARLEPSAGTTWAVANAVAGVVCVGGRGASFARAIEEATRWNAALLETASRPPR